MYVDANGNEFDSYEDACRYYGVDTPAQVEAEARYFEQLEWEEYCREHGYVPIRPARVVKGADEWTRAAEALDDECPF